MSRGLAVHPELPSGASQTPEPGLGSLAGAGGGFRHGGECHHWNLSFSAGLGCGWGFGAPSEAVLGLRAPPQTQLVWPHVSLGCLGAPRVLC